MQAISLFYRFGIGLPNGCLVVNDDDLAMTGDALLLAERSGDDFAVNSARLARGLVLAHHRGPRCAEGLNLLAIAGDAARREVFTMWTLPIIDFEIAKEKARTGDLMLERAMAADMREAQAVIDRLAADPTEPGVVLNEIALLRGRALLAKAHGDTDAFQRIVTEYRDNAISYGFAGHLAMADTLISG
jgi:adenylate cyclase